jgi:selenocysteine lyase/cysteine desulfurase
MNRRKVIGLIGAGTTASILPTSKILSYYEKSLYELDTLSKYSSTDNSEDFWNQVRLAYSTSANIINLNNGGVAPSPKIVQDAVEHYNKMNNEAPSYYMWRILDQGREPLREKMATICGCSPSELAFNRNSSEGLETIIFGLRLKAGDEVILTKQDYPNMINAWKQREKRDGIKLIWLNFDFPIEDKNIIVSAYKNAFSSKTKIVHITHMINWLGQLLPVKEIADEAKKNNIEVIVDAAHSFAHVPYKISDLNCDYWATSLHKWLSAPIGTGLLYVRKEKIKNLYPLFGAADPESEDIKKFENLGTRSFALEQAIGHAADFYNYIGAERKFDRLCTLKERWVNQFKNNPKVKINSPQNRAFGGAIGNIEIINTKPEELDNFLFNQYKIHTVGINWENIHGVRITPNVYTSLYDIDRLIEAITAFLNKK